MRSPLRSMRPMISPISPRCTPSGLTRTRVFSLLGTVEQPTGPLDQDHRALCTLEHAQRAMIKKAPSPAAVVVVRRLRNRLAVVLDVVDPVLVTRWVKPAGVGNQVRAGDQCASMTIAHRLVVLLIHRASRSRGIPVVRVVARVPPLVVPAVGLGEGPELDFAAISEVDD